MEDFKYSLKTENDNSYCAVEQNQTAIDDVIKNLTEDGIPSIFSPTNFIAKIAKEYNISKNDARQCLKTAIKILEEKEKGKAPVNSTQRPDEKLNAKSGYFYPSQDYGVQKKANGEIVTSMDNLNSFGYYNKVMFGLG